MMDFNIFTLKNGVKLIHKQKLSSEISHLGIIINAGSRDESIDKQGLAHFIEHCLFKGTQTKGSIEILNRLDKVGGEINAYTSKEETAVYASCMNIHVDRAFELITDITFNSIFPEKEIKKEKEVIIDEINSYLDTPSEQIFDDFDEIIFKDHPLGRNILGNEKTVKGFKKSDIDKFITRNYLSKNLIVSVVSNLSFEKIKQMAEKYSESITFGARKTIRKKVIKYIPQHTVIKNNTHQCHYILGNRAYPHKDKMRIPMVLLNNILGGAAMNSRLNINIREKHGIAYTIESNYQAYYDTGIFEIYIATDKSNIEKSHNLIIKELDKLMSIKLTNRQLHDSKQQIIGQITLAQESGVNTMLSYGKSLLTYNSVDTNEMLFKKIQNISSSDVLLAANEIFQPNQLSSITYT
jgi:predicted Zn-dependent peptidase